MKIDGISIDFINKNVEGPMGWINRGSFDILATLDIPLRWDKEKSGFIKKVVNELKNRLDWATPSNRRSLSQQQDQKQQPSPKIPQIVTDRLSMHLKLNLNNLRASVPLRTEDLSYANNALIRPLVGYMNAHNLRIPLEFHLDMNREDFDGAWTLYDSGLAVAISSEAGRSIVRLMYDERERARRLRKIGLWSLKRLSKTLVSLWHTMNLPSHPFHEDYYAMSYF